MVLQFRKPSLNSVSGEQGPTADHGLVSTVAFRPDFRDQMSNPGVGDAVPLTEPDHIITREMNNLRRSEVFPHTTHLHVAKDPDFKGSNLTSTDSPRNIPHSLENLAEKNSQLRSNLKAVRIECEETREGFDRCLSELIATQASLKQRDAEIARQAIELVTLQEGIARLSAELKEKTPQFSKMERLFQNREAQALAKKDAEIQVLREEVSRVAPLEKAKTGNSIDESEPLNLRRTSSRLLNELEQKEEQLRQKDSSLREWDAGYVMLHQEKEQLVAELESKYGKSQTELREYKRQCEELEARLRESEIQQITARGKDQKLTNALAEASLQKNQAEVYLQQLRELREENSALSQHSAPSINTQEVEQLQASTAAELEEARQLSNFYKNNSEQLSRKNRDAMTANRNLQDALSTKNREVDVQKSLVQALQRRLSNPDIPGQYPQY